MVKKVFTVLIVAVVCMAIGGIVLSVFMPNAVSQMVNVTEDMIYNATKLSFDFNGDGNTGGQTSGTAEGQTTQGSPSVSAPGFN